LTQFQQFREPGENLRKFLQRHSVEDMRLWLAGENIPPVERDLPSGRVPHGVEG
jgi:sulfite reductase (ferredoxin)